MSEEERARTKGQAGFVHEEPKFTSRKTVRYDYLGSGWRKKGVVFYEEVRGKWREMMRNEDWWDRLEVAWEEYESKSDVAKMWKKPVSDRVSQSRGNSAFTHMKTSFQANGARESGDVESDGESDCVSVQKRGPPKKRVQNAKILGDDSDSDSDSDSESENDF